LRHALAADLIGIICIRPCAPEGEITPGSPVDSTRITAAINSGGTPHCWLAATISGSQRRTGSSSRGIDVSSVAVGSGAFGI